MANPEISNIKGTFKTGYLEYQDLSGNVVADIFPSNAQIATITTATTLTMKGYMGKDIRVTASDVIVTLPVASTTTLAGGEFTVRNMCAPGGTIVVITTTGDNIYGAGISTSNLVGNTGATHVYGDFITVAATGSSSWYIVGLSGTWASTS